MPHSSGLNRAKGRALGGMLSAASSIVPWNSSGTDQLLSTSGSHSYVFLPHAFLPHTLLRGSSSSIAISGFGKGLFQGQLLIWSNGALYDGLVSSSSREVNQACSLATWTPELNLAISFNGSSARTEESEILKTVSIDNRYICL